MADSFIYVDTVTGTYGVVADLRIVFAENDLPEMTDMERIEWARRQGVAPKLP